MPQLALSIIVPAMNEQENVEALVAQVKASVIDAGIQAELLLIDDGSTDETAARVEALARQHAWLRLVRHGERRGQSAAMRTGFRLAAAPFVSTLDADLQNDPADLPKMLAIIQKGDVDLVQGDRSRARRDTWVRRMSSWVGRTTRRLLLGDAVRDTGCSTRVMRRELALELPLQFRGMHRFVPVYLKLMGARIVEVPVNHRPRVAGKAKYGIWNRALPGLRDCFAMRWMMSRYRVPPASLSLPLTSVAGLDASRDVAADVARDSAPAAPVSSET